MFCEPLPIPPAELTRANSAQPSACSLVVVDYFCGAGGVTCGALAAGAIVACGIDSDSRAERTYMANNRDPAGVAVPFVARRVEELSPDVVKEHLASYPNQATLFVGCPPCQPFTNLRTDKKRSHPSRETLASFIDHVVALRPEFVLVENVPGIRAKKYGDLWAESIRRLHNRGYRVRFEVVNAAQYGVAQKRMRTLLVAAAESAPPWPAPTHPAEEDFRTVRDALDGSELCPLGAGQKSEDDDLHEASMLSELNLRRIRAITRPGGTRTEWPPELWLDCYRNHQGHTDVYGRMAWDKPAPTLTTRFVSLSNGRFGHPEEDRAITPREGALLQTFPPDYRFLHESREVNVVHIGNAVPPVLARAFIAEIIRSLGGIADRPAGHRQCKTARLQDTAQPAAGYRATPCRVGRAGDRDHGGYRTGSTAL